MRRGAIEALHEAVGCARDASAHATRILRSVRDSAGNRLGFVTVHLDRPGDVTLRLMRQDACRQRAADHPRRSVRPGGESA